MRRCGRDRTRATHSESSLAATISAGTSPRTRGQLGDDRGVLDPRDPVQSVEAALDPAVAGRRARSAGTPAPRSLDRGVRIGQQLSARSGLRSTSSAPSARSSTSPTSVRRFADRLAGDGGVRDRLGGPGRWQARDGASEAHQCRDEPPCRRAPSDDDDPLRSAVQDARGYWAAGAGRSQHRGEEGRSASPTADADPWTASLSGKALADRVGQRYWNSALEGGELVRGGSERLESMDGRVPPSSAISITRKLFLPGPGPNGEDPLQVLHGQRSSASWPGGSQVVDVNGARAAAADQLDMPATAA